MAKNSFVAEITFKVNKLHSLNTFTKGFIVDVGPKRPTVINYFQKKIHINLKG